MTVTRDRNQLVACGWIQAYEAYRLRGSVLSGKAGILPEAIFTLRPAGTARDAWEWTRTEARVRAAPELNAITWNMNEHAAAVPTDESWHR